jgi:acetolactate synthase-1/2/3 large subunit
MATSGPGATNLITAIATSYYDSVPVLYITGNCTTNRQGAKFGVRQYGFQETPIVEMVKGITKFAKQTVIPGYVFDELHEAVHYAKKDRKGPVLIDIPDDLQRADISYPER